MTTRQKPKEQVEIIGIYLGGGPKLTTSHQMPPPKKDGLFTRLLKALHLVPSSSVMKTRELTKKRVLERKEQKRKLKQVTDKTKAKEQKLKNLKRNLDKNRILKTDDKEDVTLLIRDDLKTKPTKPTANTVLSTKIHAGKLGVMEKEKVSESEKNERIKKIERDYDRISKKIGDLENKEANKTLNSDEISEKKELIQSLRALRLEMRLLGKSIDSKMQIPQQIIQQPVPQLPVVVTKTKEQDANEIKKMMSALRYEYYKRRISETEYKSRLFEYQTKLRSLGFTIPKELKFEKPIKEEQKITAVTQPKIHPHPITHPKAHHKDQPVARHKVQPTEKTKEPITQLAAHPKGQPQTLSVRELKVDKLEIAQPIQNLNDSVKPKETPYDKMEMLIAGTGDNSKSSKISDSKIGQMLRERPFEKIDHKRVAELETHVKGLMKRHEISESTISDVGAVDKNKIIEDFDKLINLIDLEKHTKDLMREEHKSSHDDKIEMTNLMPVTSGDSHKKDQIKSIAKEIIKYKIVTDFDNVLQYVKSHGKVSENQLVKDLKIDRKRLHAATEVLENNELIKIEYPPFGSAIIYDAAYKKPEKEKKNKKKGS
ncbi:MAG: hypothetical protein V1672_01180 [Candidatus Diapherotrites archaeon]